MPTSASHVPLRPLPTHPRVLVLEWNLPFHVDIAEQLAKTHNWEFVYWVGDGTTFGRIVEQRFPRIIFHDTVDARFGRPPAALTDLTPRPFDEELAQSLAYEETLVLKMMDRIELEESFTYHERVRLYHRMVSWWSALLDRIKPDVMIIPTAPHVHYDYIVYSLCCRRGIRTAMFENSSVPGMLLQVRRFEKGFPELVAEYRRLISEESHTVELSQMVEDYLATNQGEYIKPHAQVFYEQIYERKPDTAAVRPRNHVATLAKLRKLVHVSRYPAYAKFILENLKRPKQLSSVDRRVSGHLRGRFIKLGEVDSEVDTVHARWVRQRREELQREYKSRVTPPDFSQPYVYVPLHVQPERSTAPNGGIYDHAELMIEALALTIPPDWLVYVKEHPSQFKPWQVGERGRRIADYAAMASTPNVRFVPLEAEPFDLIDNARAVATVTGTSGWEAIARGVPVLCFGIAWYQGCDGVFDVRSFEDLKPAIERISNGERPTANHLRFFLKALENLGFQGFLESETQAVAQISEAENIQRISEALAATVAH